MSVDVFIGVIQIILVATTPLVFAAIGELVTEKTGVLNLGVEGMMLVGAVTAFVTLVITGSYTLAFIVSLLSGALMSGLFAYLVLILMSNQVAT
jgi:simple sugar transport system permease protein